MGGVLDSAPDVFKAAIRAFSGGRCGAGGRLRGQRSGRWAWASSAGGAGGTCRGSAPPADNGEAPDRGGRAGSSSTRPISRRAPQPMPLRVPFMSGPSLLHSRSARASSASSVGCSATSTLSQPLPAASAAAGLIAAMRQMQSTAGSTNSAKTAPARGEWTRATRLRHGSDLAARRSRRAIHRDRRDRFAAHLRARGGVRRTNGAASCPARSSSSSRSTPARRSSQCRIQLRARLQR